MGHLAQIENGEFIATLGGYGKDFPPLDEKGFLEFAQLAFARSGLPLDRFGRLTVRGILARLTRRTRLILYILF